METFLLWQSLELNSNVKLLKSFHTLSVFKVTLHWVKLSRERREAKDDAVVQPFIKIHFERHETLESGHGHLFVDKKCTFCCSASYMHSLHLYNSWYKWASFAIWFIPECLSPRVLIAVLHSLKDSTPSWKFNF